MAEKKAVHVGFGLVNEGSVANPVEERGITVLTSKAKSAAMSCKKPDVLDPLPLRP